MLGNIAVDAYGSVFIKRVPVGVTKIFNNYMITVPVPTVHTVNSYLHEW